MRRLFATIALAAALALAACGGPLTKQEITRKAEGITAKADLEKKLDGVVSLESARDDYGVVIDPKSWTVDEAETGRLRR